MKRSGSTAKSSASKFVELPYPWKSQSKKVEKVKGKEAFVVEGEKVEKETSMNVLNVYVDEGEIYKKDDSQLLVNQENHTC